MKLVKSMALAAIVVLLSLMNVPAHSRIHQGGVGGGNSCSNQFINCMFSGRPVAQCTAQQRDCERALQVLLPVFAATDSAGLPVDPFAETRALQFKALLQSGGATPVAFGSTYCRKMLERCEAGNASACDLFDRHCGGA